ncbi:MAG: PAS domain-containing sensor histidine kinase [Actinomycetota bacterium]
MDQQRCERSSATERLPAETGEPRWGQELFARHLDLSLNLMGIVGFDGYLRRFNPAYRGVLGWTEEELLSRPYLGLVHPEDQDRMLAALKKLVSSEEAFQVRLMCKDGGCRWFLMSVEPVPEERLIYAVAIDITDYKYTEEALRAELEHFAVINDRRRIAQELHDDIVQSLFAVGMTLRAAMQTASDPQTVSTWLGEAVDEIDRVVKDLRSYIFGLRPDPPGAWKLNRSLREVVKCWNASSTRIELEIDSEAASLAEQWTADILQIAREAVSNAVQHSNAKHITIRLIILEGEILLEVLDDGRGFNRSQVCRKGCGISGLQARAEAMQGRLDILSDIGLGTRIRLRLPAYGMRSSERPIT